MEQTKKTDIFRKKVYLDEFPALDYCTLSKDYSKILTKT